SAFEILKRGDADANADDYKIEKAFFRFSIAYLFLSFGALLVEATLKSFGLGGW
ncbi:MAG: protoheme IX farnesyltransferase, partial [Paracoccaceae bacterium]